MDKKNTRCLMCLLAVSVVYGCSSSPPPISMVGEKGDINLLVGTWRGEYEADDGSRDGTIEFVLVRDSDTATGSVIMSVRDDARTDARDTPSADDLSLARRPVIRFVQLGKGYVSGRLDPYEDPDCRCVIETLFEGKLDGDEIVGTYTSKGVYEQFLRTGTWKVQRTSGGEEPKS